MEACTVVIEMKVEKCSDSVYIPEEESTHQLWKVYGSVIKRNQG